jgi:hypothetical protein
MELDKLITTIVLTMLVVGGVASAQEELPSPGLLPDHPFYEVKMWWEDVRMFFTFNSKDKAKLHLEFASIRLAEVNEMIKKNKTKFIQELLEDYKKELNETEDKVEELKARGKNITILAEHVSNVTYKHVFILEEVLEKVPEQAKIHIEHAINVSIKGHEIAVESILVRVNKTIQKVRRINCTTDADCRHLFCPMVLGSDTPICREGKCVCGAKWEIVNKTEWVERFNETWTNVTQRKIKKIEEIYERIGGIPEIGCHKYYECFDGTKVPWCAYENDRCVCIISPEVQCPKVDLLLEYVYGQDCQ